MNMQLKSLTYHCLMNMTVQNTYFACQHMTVNQKVWWIIWLFWGFIMLVECDMWNKMTDKNQFPTRYILRAFSVLIGTKSYHALDSLWVYWFRISFQFHVVYLYSMISQKLTQYTSFIINSLETIFNYYVIYLSLWDIMICYFHLLIRYLRSEITNTSL